MYILTRLEPRAETTDTILYYCTKKRNTLEEFILSLWEELLEDEWAYRQYFSYSHEDYIEKTKKYINTFHIVRIPYMED